MAGNAIKGQCYMGKPERKSRCQVHGLYGQDATGDFQHAVYHTGRISGYKDGYGGHQHIAKDHIASEYPNLRKAF